MSDIDKAIEEYEEGVAMFYTHTTDVHPDKIKLKEAIEKDKMESVEKAYKAGAIFSNPNTYNDDCQQYKQDNKV